MAFQNRQTIFAYNAAHHQGFQLTGRYDTDIGLTRNHGRQCSGEFVMREVRCLGQLKKTVTRNASVGKQAEECQPRADAFRYIGDDVGVKRFREGFDTATVPDDHSHGGLITGIVGITSGSSGNLDGSQFMSGVAEDTAIRKEEIELSVLQFLEKLIQGKLL